MTAIPEEEVRPVVPSHVAQPQDHKPAAAPEPETVTFDYAARRYTVALETLDDIEILENVEDNNLTKALRAILGQDQYDEFKNSVRLPSGRVPADTLGEIFETITKAAKAGKVSR